ncbi:MAG: DNA primase [Elusimicrobia bacterium]|nr:DNA primase [Elusimicrobiota bacterium]
MFISEDTVARVREANEIVEVIHEYVPHLKRAGKDYKANCPFHQEKTPSFVVSSEKGIYHCFGCGVGGDVFKFVMELERCSYGEAIKKLAQRKGIPVEEKETNPQYIQEQEKRKKQLLILKRAARFYHKSLMESEEAATARHYLTKERGLTLETIEKFQIGWAQKSGAALLKTALKAGIELTELREIGLIFKREESGKCLDQFRERILFPIFDLKGDVIGFGGRILNEKKSSGDYQPPKYINSQESSIFQKGKNLYGFFQGLKKIREQKELVLVEGYMDVVGCHQAGILNVAAPLGTSLTMDQCQLLKRYVEQVTLLFDSDPAGDRATQRGAELLLDLGFMPMVTRLPSGVDADEYLKNHPREDFEKLLEQKYTIFEFQLKLELEKNSTLPEMVKKTTVLQSLFPLLLKIENEITRSEMIKILSSRLKIKEDLLYAELKKIQNGKSRILAKEFQTSKFQKLLTNSTSHLQKKELLSAEEELLCLAVRFLDLRPFLVQAQKTYGIFSDLGSLECLELFERQELLELGSFLNHLSEESSKRLSDLLMKQRGVSNPREVFDLIFNRIELKMKEVERKSLEKDLVQILNNGDSVGQAELLRYQELTQTLKGKGKDKKYDFKERCVN